MTLKLSHANDTKTGHQTKDLIRARRLDYLTEAEALQDSPTADTNETVSVKLSHIELIGE